MSVNPLSVIYGPGPMTGSKNSKNLIISGNETLSIRYKKIKNKIPNTFLSKILRNLPLIKRKTSKYIKIEGSEKVTMYAKVSRSALKTAGVNFGKDVDITKDVQNKLTTILPPGDFGPLPPVPSSAPVTTDDDASSFSQELRNALNKLKPVTK